MYISLLMGFAYFFGSVLLTLIAGGMLGVALWRRSRWLALVAILGLLASLPGTGFVLAVGHTYRVPGWWTPPPLVAQYVSPSRTIDLLPDATFVLAEPSGRTTGTWSAVAATGDGPTANAWTLELTLTDGGTRYAAVGWDGRLGINGEFLEPE